MPNAQLLPPARVSDIRTAFRRLTDALGRFHASLTARETLALELGLRRGHYEVAVATKETTRAKEHEARARQLQAQLGRLGSREQIVEQLGEKGAFIEEAIAHGRLGHAQKLFDEMLTVAQALSIPQSR